MPTYIYRRVDGTTFEIEQRITEDALSTCPTTGQAVTRVITGGTGLIFKGNGFYLTDYARGNSSKSGDNGKSQASTSANSTDAGTGESTQPAASKSE